MSHLDPLLLARIQFGFTISFHIIFPAITIGLGSYLAVLEGLWLLQERPGLPRPVPVLVEGLCGQLRHGRRLRPGHGLSVRHQLESLFRLRRGRHRAAARYEVLTAFFLEAGFLGVMLFGWNKVGPGLHFFSTLMVAAGTLVSMTWILASNSWMQTPQGYEVINGRVVPTDWLKVVFNPSFPYRLVHMGLAAYLATALMVGAAGAWHLLKHRDNPRVRTMFSMAMWMVLITAPVQIVAGDQQGLNTLQYQPAKVAAMEGDWTSKPGEGEPLILFGLPDMAEQKTLDAVEIPHLGSLILTHTWNGQIRGLDDFPANDRPDSTIIFWTFRIMVGLAMLMLLLGLGGAWFRWRGQLYDQRLFLRFATAMGPAGLIAIIAGWITTEVGRQPWVVYGVMRTSDAVSHHSALAMSGSLLLFVVVYCAVFGTGISYLVKVMAQGPDRSPPTPDAEDLNRRPARPLSAAPDIDPSPLSAGE